LANSVSIPGKLAPMATTAILTAAGSGTRLGAKLPKALVLINGVPIVRVAAENLFASGVVDDVIVTVPPGFMDQFTAALDGIEQPLTFIEGGERRQDSIANALRLLLPQCNKVLVHDAARPFAPPELIAAVANAVTAQVKAVIPGLPVVDTIVQTTSEPAPPDRAVAWLGELPAGTSPAGTVPKTDIAVLARTLDRAALRAVQTPQGFDRETLVSAYQNAMETGLTATDDAGLVAALGVPVTIIPGSPVALKITTPTDLAVARLER